MALHGVIISGDGNWRSIAMCQGTNDVSSKIGVTTTILRTSRKLQEISRSDTVDPKIQWTVYRVTLPLSGSETKAVCKRTERLRSRCPLPAPAPVRRQGVSGWSCGEIECERSVRTACINKIEIRAQRY